MRGVYRKDGYDRELLLCVILLVGMGVAFLYSVGAYNGTLKFQNAFYYSWKQGLAALLGMVGMLLIARLDYHYWIPFAKWGYWLSLGFSLLVLFVGEEYNGSRRWLSLGGISFQPSEFAKVAVILFLASGIARRGEGPDSLGTLLKFFLPILPVVGLVGASNLSTAIILLGIGGILLFVASARYGQFFWILGGGILFLTIFLAAESYRLERLAIWRNPEKFEKGYQTVQGLYAIAGGGLFGKGVGGSIQKLGFLPEAQNDMIFSILCEELGLTGAVGVLLLFLLLLWRFFVIAVNAPDLFGLLLVAGVMAHIMLQVLFNIAVVTNTIPNTGITLPFISYGGTSILFLLFEMGLVCSVSGASKNF